MVFAAKWFAKSCCENKRVIFVRAMSSTKALLYDSAASLENKGA